MVLATNILVLVAAVGLLLIVVTRLKNVVTVDTFDKRIRELEKGYLETLVTISDSADARKTIRARLDTLEDHDDQQ